MIIDFMKEIADMRPTRRNRYITNQSNNFIK